jgi:hypothetical protein
MHLISSTANHVIEIGRDAMRPSAQCQRLGDARERYLIVRPRLRRWNRLQGGHGRCGHDLGDQKPLPFQLFRQRCAIPVIGHAGHAGFVGSCRMAVEDRYAHVVPAASRQTTRFRVALIFINPRDQFQKDSENTYSIS